MKHYKDIITANELSFKKFLCVNVKITTINNIWWNDDSIVVLLETNYINKTYVTITESELKFFVDSNVPKFLNMNEIVDDMLQKEPLTIIQAALHPIGRGELRRYISNKYNLWNENNPYTIKMWKDNKNIINGIEYSPYHPDNFADSVISLLIDTHSVNYGCNKKYT